ncbi:hypothetical protein MMC13_007104 [Lambiella insularis]|nr:hypothetical protein [Lambiella insularis]
MIPKFLRQDKNRATAIKSPKSKDWNPATFYIAIFLLIGSNAIQMITLRNDLVSFSRKADAKIGLLKEVLERVQRGEDVDVEGLLGTGNEEKEKEWENVLREIEQSEQLWKSKAEKKAKRSTKAVTQLDPIAHEAATYNASVSTLDTVQTAVQSRATAAQGSGHDRGEASRRPLAFY